ncbi:MAG: amino acid ABC transporter substrate-binding protein [Reyranella sp.]|jgi:branched-chain amino acid transport system substrate-binding protein|uniref:amino acid ABC transporter substrate-binding protein n=1 Tax=Reyranella sp. TaxID=1929291 RepID=UPI0025EE36D8|nr:amino acid ABC transporter substrate-binding protein [Reyranella sp.]MBR2813714.1 amino acid ABC transporter substrate-binding protein [Reyranella sp.]
MKRRALGALAVSAAAMLAVAPASAQDKVKIGYAISKTGPNAGGASITQIPNYEMWVKDVNAKGGLLIGGKRVPIEVVEYDDRSNSEEAVRAVERLVTQDKVDLLFPPWGTGLNLAVGPVFNKYGYPQLTFSAVTDRAPELAKRWPNSFWLLGTSKQYVDALAALLKKMRDEGKIGPNVAMISIADGFGIDLSQAARKSFGDAGFKLAYDKSYPIGTQDLSPLIGEAQRSGADTFVAFSYPPDTMALTEQSKVASYAPKVMFLGVGVGFPMYPQRFGANAEGIMSLGGWSKDNASTAAYAKKHEEMFKRGPDRWGSQIGYSSLQMLEQAIERVGKIDRPAIIKELQTGTFDTVLGKVKLVDNQMIDNYWLIGQWQDGFFVGVAPQRAGVGTPIVPKAPWKP